MVTRDDTRLIGEKHEAALSHISISLRVLPFNLLKAILIQSIGAQRAHTRHTPFIGYHVRSRQRSKFESAATSVQVRSTPVEEHQGPTDTRTDGRRTRAP